MWDESDRDDPSLDDTANRSDPRRKEDPIDLPLDQASGRSSTSQSAPPPPAIAPPSRRSRNPLLFPDWPPRGPARPATGPKAPARVENRPGTGPDHGPGWSQRVPVTSRLLAGLVDLSMLVLVTAVLALSVRLPSGVGLGWTSFVWTSLFALELSLVGGTLALFLFGRTPGMALLALTAEEEGGLSLRFGRSLLRVVVGMLLPGITLLPSFARKDRRSLTDLVSSTSLRDAE